LNVSMGASIAGARVIATGFVGGHAGNYIEESLRPFGIHSRFYHVEGESRSCINIWDEKNGTQTEFLEPGFTLTEADFQGFLARFEELLPEADVVTMSGSVPKGLDSTAYRVLIRACRRAGKQVILDTSGKLLEQGIEECPTLIKPNIDEIRMLTGQECTRLEEILEAAKALHRRGIPFVAVSLGSEGAVLACEEGVFRATVPKIDAVNTVGCGDAMIAGFAMGMAEKLPADEMLRRASAISAASARHPQTGIFCMEDYRYLLPRVRVQKII